MHIYYIYPYIYIYISPHICIFICISPIGPKDGQTLLVRSVAPFAWPEAGSSTAKEPQTELEAGSSSRHIGASYGVSRADPSLITVNRGYIGTKNCHRTQHT